MVTDKIEYPPGERPDGVWLTEDDADELQAAINAVAQMPAYLASPFAVTIIRCLIEGRR